MCGNVIKRITVLRGGAVVALRGRGGNSSSGAGGVPWLVAAVW